MRISAIILSVLTVSLAPIGAKAADFGPMFANEVPAGFQDTFVRDNFASRQQEQQDVLSAEEAATVEPAAGEEVVTDMDLPLSIAAPTGTGVLEDDAKDGSVYISP